MKLVGQCPSCHAHYQLDPEDIGHALQCECGVNLFASSTAAIDQKTVCCTDCGQVHLVQTGQSTEWVNCECGTKVLVPTVILRMPLTRDVENGGSDRSSRDSQAEIQAVGEPALKTKRKPVINCPQCSKAYEVDKSDLNQQSQCECGCVFATEVDQDRQLIALITESELQPRDDETERRSASERPASLRKKSRSWVEIFGALAVFGFLIASVIVFALRDRATTEPESVATQGAASSTSDDSSETYSVDALKEAITMAGFNRESFQESTLLRLSEPASTSNRAAASAGSSRSSGNDQSEPSEKLRLPPLAQRPLPQPNKTRERIEPVPASSQGLTFEKAYENAFAAYRETTDLKTKFGTSPNPNQSAQLRERIGVTLGLLQSAHDLGMRRGDHDKVNELRYFLTWMYYHAGCLPESAVVGGAVARWGGKDHPATKEAAMVALAATQEASATQWALPDRVGELDHMQAIIDVVQKRWPGHPQLETMRMNLATSYDAFSQYDAAVSNYKRIGKDSPHYEAAQLAAGNALWTQFRRTFAGDEELAPRAKTLLRSAREYLAVAVKPMQADAKTPSLELIQTKLTLARIDTLLGSLTQASNWLSGKPFPLTESVALSKPTRRQVAVPASVIRGIFDLQFAVRSQLDDATGAKASLQQLSKILGQKSGEEVGDKMFGVAIEFINESTANGKIDPQAVKTLDELLAPLQGKQSTLTAENRLWIGESWSQFADRAVSPALARDCFEKAAASFAAAMQSPGFDNKSRTAAQIRQTQFLRKAGRLSDALDVIEQMLQLTPNVFSLQMEAAMTIERIALDDADPEGLLHAVQGPPDSAVWGWNKLVTALHSMRFSSKGTEEHAKQLLQAQEHLVRCRWLLCQATIDPVEQSKSKASVAKILNRLMQTTSPQQQPEFGRLKQLNALLDT
tara:strand:+ start:1600 stop:4347 length:2748 start_codon:yes stop_codon:yes gene_type:complete